MATDVAEATTNLDQSALDTCCDTAQTIANIRLLLSTPDGHETQLNRDVRQAALEQLDQGSAITFESAQQDTKAMHAQTPRQRILEQIITAAASHAHYFDADQRRQAALDLVDQLCQRQADHIAKLIAQDKPTPLDHTTRSFVLYQNEISRIIDHAIDHRYPYTARDAATDILAATRGELPARYLAHDFGNNHPFQTLDFEQQAAYLANLPDDRASGIARTHIAHIFNYHLSSAHSPIRQILRAVQDKYAEPLTSAYAEANPGAFRAIKAEIALIAQTMALCRPMINLRPYPHVYNHTPMIAGPTAASQYTPDQDRYNHLHRAVQEIANPVLRLIAQSILENLVDQAGAVTSSQFIHLNSHNAILAISEADHRAQELQLTQLEPDYQQPVTTVNITSRHLNALVNGDGASQSPQAAQPVRAIAVHIAQQELTHALRNARMDEVRRISGQLSENLQSISRIAFPNTDYFEAASEFHDAATRNPDMLADATIAIGDSYLKLLNASGSTSIVQLTEYVIHDAARLIDYISADQTPDEDVDSVDRMYAYADIAYAQAIIDAMLDYLTQQDPAPAVHNEAAP